MAVRLPTACVLLAVLVTWGHAASAKPPDLPVNEKVTCTLPAPPEEQAPIPNAPAVTADGEKEFRDVRITIHETTPGSLMFGVGASSDAGVTGSVILVGEGQAVSSDGPTCPYLRQQAQPKPAVECMPPLEDEALGNLKKLVEAAKLYKQAEADRRRGKMSRAQVGYRKVQQLCPGSRYAALAAQRLQDATTAATAEEADQVAPMPPQKECEDSATCPHPKRKAGKMNPSAGAGQTDDVLGNLAKLEKAEAMYRQAEFYRRTGHPGSACFCYETIRRLCPGSRYAALAAEKIRAMQAPADRPTSATDTEEQEPAPAKGRTERQLEQGRISVVFQKARVGSMLKDLRNATGLNLTLDEQAIEAEGISLARPVTMKLDNVPLKAVLEEACKQTQLTYQLDGEVVVVTAAARARGKIHCRVYQVSDLVFPGTDDVCRGVLNKTRAEQPFEEQLINLITCIIHPQSWSEKGGPGTIDYFPPSMTLVVNQTMEVHEQIADLIAGLRRQMEKPAAAGEEKSGTPHESSDPTPDGAGQVNRLLEECHRAFVAGRHAEAEGLARQALALDAAAAAAHPLVYKMHLFDQLRKQTRHSTQAAPPCEMRRPDLPRVDPKMVEVMDTVLHRVGESNTPNLVIRIEEAGGDEEQEAGARLEKKTELFVAPVGPLTLACQEEAVRDLAGAARSAVCFDVDVTARGGRCRVQIGGMAACLTWGEGLPSLTLSLAPAGETEH